MTSGGKPLFGNEKELHWLVDLSTILKGEALSWRTGEGGD